MKLSRKTTLALLLSLITFNILLRYPQSGHELGVDSFFVHALASSILVGGHARWILNPLSYFGLYPLSYPSAGPFFLASLSSSTGLNLEAAILLMSLLLGPIGILGAFVMAREFRDDPTFALGVALIYGLAPRFLVFTLWSASTRNLFMALLPLFIWALLRNYRKASWPNALVLALVFMTVAATHRLVVLMLGVVVAFVLAIVVLVALRILRIRFPRQILHNSARKVAPHLALGVVVAISVGILAATDVLEEYSVGEFGSGTDVSTQLINLGISIARSGGLALPLVLVGLVVITRQRGKTIREPFLALTFLALIPTLSLRQYTGFYILPFLAIFGGLGLVGLMNVWRRRPRAYRALALALVVAISGFSMVVLDIEVQRSSTLDDRTYNTGLYVGAVDLPGTLVVNDGLHAVRVAAISGARVLPVGGAGTTFQSPELLAYGFYTGDEVNQRVVRMDIFSLTIESDSLWIATGIQAELDWVTILESPYGAIPDSLRERYRPSLYLELRSASGSYLAYDNRYCSDLGLTVRQSGYRLFENEVHTLWWLHAPSVTPTPGGTQTCP